MRLIQIFHFDGSCPMQISGIHNWEQKLSVGSEHQQVYRKGIDLWCGITIAGQENPAHLLMVEAWILLRVHCTSVQLLSG